LIKDTKVYNQDQGGPDHGRMGLYTDEVPGYFDNVILRPIEDQYEHPTSNEAAAKANI